MPEESFAVIASHEQWHSKLYKRTVYKTKTWFTRD